MSLVPRNAPCPCGSGLKYKRCCVDREREVLRRAEVAEELLGLAAMFPLLRPDSAEFDACVDAHRHEDVTRARIEEAVNLLPEAERERIRHAHAREFPGVWRRLVDDYGDESEAKELVLVGAVAAALREDWALDPSVLELLEVDEELAADAAEALALALDPGGLWSIAEAALTEAALAALPTELSDEAYELVWTATIEEEAARHWTPRHESRLARLVDRLRAQLAVEDSPRSTAALAGACATFEHDQQLRTRLAALLLADSLGPLWRFQAFGALAV